ncbi:hypothetical protein [uncultured Arcticibacterium sp.]|uniref:hypothetical protein n=1 Tax=uncultured Arcticibacterium sp. TaxID=2173042 RepID=UPI0030FB53E9
MKNALIKFICVVFFISSCPAFAQSGIVLPYGIKVPEVADLEQVVSPIEGMMVYSEQQQSLFLRKGSSWEAISQEVPSSEAHIFVEIYGEDPDLYDETVSKDIHSSESKVLEVDFKFYKTAPRGSALASLKFKKKLGRSSLRIQKSIMDGKIHQEVIFTFYVRDPSTLIDIPYYRYTFEVVTFMSDQIIGPHAELNTLVDDSPTRNAKSLVEEIEFVYEKMTVEDLVNNASFVHEFDTPAGSE